MAENELPHYREMVSAKMSADRSEIQRTLSAKRGKTTWGIVSLGAGLLGAAGAATVYVLGTQAADSYAKAIGTASLQAARSQIELYGSLLPATAALGGLGLGLSPMLLFGGPDPRALQRSVDSLSDQIKALEKR